MSEPLRPADFAALVASEIAAAVAAVYTGENAAITKLIVKVGEPASTFDDVSWLAELTVDPRSIGHGVSRGHDAPTLRIPRQIAELPVSAISGVSAAWSETLARVEIVSVGDLAGADQRTLARLEKRTRSRRIFTLASRARLCALGPIPVVKDPTLAVRDAIAMESSDLARNLALDGSSVAVFHDALSRLTSALDAAVLDQMTLAWLPN